MKNNIWKVIVIEGNENLFEQLCEENNIKYKQYPKPFEGIYRTECEKDKLLDIGYCIATLEEMPEVTLGLIRELLNDLKIEAYKSTINK